MCQCHEFIHRKFFHRPHAAVLRYTMVSVAFKIVSSGFWSTYRAWMIRQECEKAWTGGALNRGCHLCLETLLLFPKQKLFFYCVPVPLWKSVLKCLRNLDTQDASNCLSRNAGKCWLQLDPSLRQKQVLDPNMEAFSCPPPPPQPLLPSLLLVSVTEISQNKTKN